MQYKKLLYLILNIITHVVGTKKTQQTTKQYHTAMFFICNCIGIPKASIVEPYNDQISY